MSISFFIAHPGRSEEAASEAIRFHLHARNAGVALWRESIVRLQGGALTRLARSRVARCRVGTKAALRRSARTQCMRPFEGAAWSRLVRERLEKVV
ncbi:MAG: hypothetical protein AB7O26_08810 [Planctomycetaceae bacterium]